MCSIQYCTDCHVHYVKNPIDLHRECQTRRQTAVIPFIRDNLSAIETATFKGSKEVIAIDIYTILEANTWFLRVHPKFTYTVLKKINEFAMCDEAHVQREDVKRLYTYVAMNNQCRHAPEKKSLDTYDLVK